MKKLLITLIILCLLLSSCGLFSPGQVATGTETQTETETVETNPLPEETETESETEPVFVFREKAELNLEDITSTEENTLQTNGEFTPEQAEALKKLEQKAKESNKKLSFAAFSLDGSQSFFYNSDLSHSSACTIKAPYVLWLCKHLDELGTDPSTVMVYERDDYETGGGVIRKEKFGTEYSLEYVIKMCLKVSDNVAYNMLLRTFGRDGYNKYMKSLGCDGLAYFRPDSKYSTRCNAAEFALVWTEIYNYFREESTYSEIMRKACTNSILNYSTENVKDWDYSHKSGENDWQLNDAGIVWKNTPYVLVVLYNGSYLEKESQEFVTSLCDIVHFEIF